MNLLLLISGHCIELEKFAIKLMWLETAQVDQMTEGRARAGLAPAVLQLMSMMRMQRLWKHLLEQALDLFRSETVRIGPRPLDIRERMQYGCWCTV